MVVLPSSPPATPPSSLPDAPSPLARAAAAARPRRPLRVVRLLPASPPQPAAYRREAGGRLFAWERAASPPPPPVPSEPIAIPRGRPDRAPPAHAPATMPGSFRVGSPPGPGSPAVGFARRYMLARARAGANGSAGAGSAGAGPASASGSSVGSADGRPHSLA